MDWNNTTDSIGTVSFHKTEKRKLSLNLRFCQLREKTSLSQYYYLTRKEMIN